MSCSHIKLRPAPIIKMAAPQTQPGSVAEIVPFSELCGLLDKIDGRKGTEEKRKILRQFIDRWREFHEKIHGNDKTVVSRPSGRPRG